MIKFLKENWVALLTILFHIAVGILLLIDPDYYSLLIIRIAGGLLVTLGVFDLIRYFRTEPEAASKGTAFSSGITQIAAGFFCIFMGSWLEEAFPMLAVLFGVFQILFGFRKLQRMTDDLRMKKELWWLRAISAALSIVFGLIITLNPEMKLMGIWVFTGITLIIEGVFDAIALIIQHKYAPKAEA